MSFGVVAKFSNVTTLQYPTVSHFNSVVPKWADHALCALKPHIKKLFDLDHFVFWCPVFITENMLSNTWTESQVTLLSKSRWIAIQK